MFQLRRWHPAHGPAPELAQVSLGEAEADGRPDDDAGVLAR